MNLNDDEINGKYDKQCTHCTRNTRLPLENEQTCSAFGYKVKKT